MRRKKIPTVWNQTYFVPNQVDEKLAFKNDYQPWKTHNTWMQQPLECIPQLLFYPSLRHSLGLDLVQCPVKVAF